MVWLLLGDYESRLARIRMCWKTKEFAAPPRKEPRWDGSPLDGQTILLTAEQGLGDTIQFVRYATDVKARGGKVVLVCPRMLVPLFKTCPGTDEVLPREEPLQPFDVYAPTLCAPRDSRNDAEATIPNNVPYLSADSKLIEKWCGARRDSRLQNWHRLAGQPAVPRRPPALDPPYIASRRSQKSKAFDSSAFKKEREPNNSLQSLIAFRWSISATVWIWAAQPSSIPRPS